MHWQCPRSEPTHYGHNLSEFHQVFFSSSFFIATEIRGALLYFNPLEKKHRRVDSADFFVLGKQFEKHHMYTHNPLVLGGENCVPTRKKK